MNDTRPTIDQILRPFFDELLAGKKGVTRRRLELIEQRLRECLEIEGHRVLETDGLEIIAAERQFNSQGAVARTMHADDLVFLLRIFVNEPWLPEDQVQRRRQLQVTDALASHLLKRRFITRFGLECPLLDIHAALLRERARPAARIAEASE